MSANDDRPLDSSDDQTARQGVSRRDVFTKGVASGVLGAAALSAPTLTEAQEAGPTGSQWTYEADVIVVGAGCAGLPVAIRARDAGLSVILIDQNFDVGGKMLHSGAQISLGGGDPVQMRDIKGEKDKEGFVTAKPAHKPEEMTEDPDFLFRDITDWSVIDNSAAAPYRYNDRDMHRAWADNCGPTRQFLIDNYIRFGRISGTHPNNGISRARRSTAFLMLGDKTDIKAGTVTRKDAGVENESSSHFAPRYMADGSRLASKGAVTNGAALSRGLEFSAREKGAIFILNRRMTELIREQPFSGKVLGVKAEYTPRFDPDSGAQLKSYWTNGNVENTAPVISLRAKRAVMVSTGGHSQNTEFRSMFYPAMRDPAYGSSAMALLGPHGQDASGIIAGIRIGAGLAGMQQNQGISISYHIPPRIGTRDSYTDMLPGHPTFSSRGSTGITLGTSAYEHLVAVNQVGKRFYNEMDIAKSYNTPVWPGGASAGSPTKSMDHVQGDWRNCHPDWVRKSYSRSAALDAAIAMNEGSTAPEYYSGPIWAIFDQGTIDRDGWEVRFPFVSERNGCFHKADTLEELTAKIQKYEFQRVPIKHLADTIRTWNSYVESGIDPDFGRGKDAPMHKIEKPPFYAALIAPIWHDSYGGLRINGKGEVLDMSGQVIPGLFAGGEASGGGNQHGLGRGLVQGYIAGTSITSNLG
jgi:hypothetical protein